MKVYLVGGAVRDKLLGLPVTEKDWVVVGSTPEQMIARGFRPVGKDFPVFLHPTTNEEYALARTERKHGRGYQGFVFNASPDVTLEQDLIRRDMTINAIAETADGELIDPYGGLDDLKNRKLRHVSDAFIEDPVRVLRVARFAARFEKFNFKVADTTMDLMRHMVINDEVSHLVPERVWQELYKALQETHPSQFFHILRACGADKVVFPEIDNLFGIPNPEKHHPEIDTGVHTMMVLDAAAQLTDSPKIRLAALLHDLGKAVTPKEQWPKHIGHEAKGVPLVNAFCDRIKTPKDYKELAVLVAKYHLECHKCQEFKNTTLVKFLERVDAYRRFDRFKEFLMACEADSKGRLGFEENEYPQREFLLEAYALTNNIDVKPLMEQGLKGLKLANAIHNERVQRLDAWRAGK